MRAVAVRTPRGLSARVPFRVRGRVAANVRHPTAVTPNLPPPPVKALKPHARDVRGGSSDESDEMLPVIARDLFMQLNDYRGKYLHDEETGLLYDYKKGGKARWPPLVAYLEKVAGGKKTLITVTPISDLTLFRDLDQHLNGSESARASIKDLFAQRAAKRAAIGKGPSMTASNRSVTSGPKLDIETALSILEKHQPKLQLSGSHVRAVLGSLLTLLRGDALSAVHLCKDVKMLHDVHQRLATLEGPSIALLNTLATRLASNPARVLQTASSLSRDPQGLTFTEVLDLWEGVVPEVCWSLEDKDGKSNTMTCAMWLAFHSPHSVASGQIHVMDVLKSLRAIPCHTLEDVIKPGFVLSAMLGRSPSARTRARASDSGSDDEFASASISSNTTLPAAAAGFGLSGNKDHHRPNATTLPALASPAVASLFSALPSGTGANELAQMFQQMMLQQQQHLNMTQPPSLALQQAQMQIAALQQANQQQATLMASLRSAPLLNASMNSVSNTQLAWPGGMSSINELDSTLDSSGRLAQNSTVPSRTHPNRKIVQLQHYKNVSDGQSYSRDADTGLLYRVSEKEDWPELAGKLLVSGKVLHIGAGTLSKIHDALKRLSVDNNRMFQLFQAASRDHNGQADLRELVVLCREVLGVGASDANFLTALLGSDLAGKMSFDMFESGVFHSVESLDSVTRSERRALETLHIAAVAVSGDLDVFWQAYSRTDTNREGHIDIIHAGRFFKELFNGMQGYDLHCLVTYTYMMVVDRSGLVRPDELLQMLHAIPMKSPTGTMHKVGFKLPPVHAPPPASSSPPARSYAWQGSSHARSVSPSPPNTAARSAAMSSHDSSGMHLSDSMIRNSLPNPRFSTEANLPVGNYQQYTPGSSPGPMYGSPGMLAAAQQQQQQQQYGAYPGMGQYPQYMAQQGQQQQQQQQQYPVQQQPFMPYMMPQQNQQTPLMGYILPYSAEVYSQLQFDVQGVAGASVPGHSRPASRAGSHRRASSSEDLGSEFELDSTPVDPATAASRAWAEAEALQTRATAAAVAARRVFQELAVTHPAAVFPPAAGIQQASGSGRPSASGPPVSALLQQQQYGSPPVHTAGKGSPQQQLQLQQQDLLAQQSSMSKQAQGTGIAPAAVGLLRTTPFGAMQDLHLFIQSSPAIFQNHFQIVARPPSQHHSPQQRNSSSNLAHQAGNHPAMLESLLAKQSISILIQRCLPQAGEADVLYIGALIDAALPMHVDITVQDFEFAVRQTASIERQVEVGTLPAPLRQTLSALCGVFYSRSQHVQAMFRKLDHTRCGTLSIPQQVALLQAVQRMSHSDSLWTLVALYGHNTVTHGKGVSTFEELAEALSKISSAPSVQSHHQQQFPMQQHQQYQHHAGGYSMPFQQQQGGYSQSGTQGYGQPQGMLDDEYYRERAGQMQGSPFPYVPPDRHNSYMPQQDYQRQNFGAPTSGRRDSYSSGAVYEGGNLRGRTGSGGGFGGYQDGGGGKGAWNESVGGEVGSNYQEASQQRQPMLDKYFADSDVLRRKMLALPTSMMSRGKEATTVIQPSRAAPAIFSPVALGSSRGTELGAKISATLDDALKMMQASAASGESVSLIVSAAASPKAQIQQASPPVPAGLQSVLDRLLQMPGQGVKAGGPALPISNDTLQLAMVMRQDYAEMMRLHSRDVHELESQRRSVEMQSQESSLAMQIQLQLLQSQLANQASSLQKSIMDDARRAEDQKKTQEVRREELRVAVEAGIAPYKMLLSQAAGSSRPPSPQGPPSPMLSPPMFSMSGPQTGSAYSAGMAGTGVSLPVSIPSTAVYGSASGPGGAVPYFAQSVGRSVSPPLTYFQPPQAGSYAAGQSGSFQTMFAGTAGSLNGGGGGVGVQASNSSQQAGGGGWTGSGPTFATAAGPTFAAPAGGSSGAAPSFGQIGSRGGMVLR